MSKPTEYLISQKLVAMIEAAKPSLHLLRLFHACYAYVDRHPLLNVGIIALQGKPACTALSSDLAAITGSPCAKSNTWIRTAVEQGAWDSLFEKLSLDTTGRLLTFKFARKVGVNAQRSEKDKVFAMIDSMELRKISSSAEALFYTKAVMVNQANQPMFSLPKLCPETKLWTDSAKKSWLRIATRVGERLSQHYVFLPQRDQLTREITQVTVKVVTSTSLWSRERLFRRPPCPPISVVHDGKFYSLTQSDLHARLSWTRVIGP